jgi:dipeptidyl aminopeptidase/acylaminoacyl peptidase
MSSWIIGHDTRFSAAVVGAPCINLSSMYGTSDIGVRFGEVQWGGQRNDALDAFLEHSPLTYAANVETPVLLLHGEDDVRCPIEQSEQYFVALSRLGKEVELVRFPGSAHGFTRSGHPRMRQEYLTRLLAWMDRYVGARRSDAPTANPVPADG